MPATSQDIVHYAGNTRYLNFAITKEDGSALNLSSVIAIRWWMGKNNRATGTDVYIKKSDQIGTGEGGITKSADTNGFYTVTVLLESDDTEDIAPGNYYHELEVVDGASEVSTMAIGKFKLNPVIIDPDLDD